MVYANYGNIMGGSEHTIKKNTVECLVTCKENLLEVNADNTKNMFISVRQNAERSEYVKNDDSAFERADDFKCLGKTLKNNNSVERERN